MTDQNSVWESSFRQPSADTSAAELARLNQAVANANARTQVTETGLASANTTLALKANTNSPAFTGTPTAPLVTSWAAGSALVNQDAMRNYFGMAVWVSSGGTQALVNGAWTLCTTAGTLPSAVGPVALGAGGQGIQVNETGVWLYTVNANINTGAGGTRIIGALGFGAGVGQVGPTLQNTATPGTTDTHVCYTMLARHAPTQVRPAFYLDNATGATLTISSIIAVRLGP